MKVYLFLALSSAFMGSIWGESYASPNYTLSFPKDLEYLPPQTTRPVSDSDLISLIGTVYETSTSFQNVLYSTFRMQIKEGGNVVINALSNSSASSSKSWTGTAKCIYKEEGSSIFLYKCNESKKEFTHVLYMSKDGSGQLITTSGNEYLKCFVRIESKEKPL